MSWRCALRNSSFETLPSPSASMRSKIFSGSGRPPDGPGWALAEPGAEAETVATAAARRQVTWCKRMMILSGTDLPQRVVRIRPVAESPGEDGAPSFGRHITTSWRGSGPFDDGRPRADSNRPADRVCERAAGAGVYRSRPGIPDRDRPGRLRPLWRSPRGSPIISGTPAGTDRSARLPRTCGQPPPLSVQGNSKPE